MVFFSENHAKHIDTLSGENRVSFIFKEPSLNYSEADVLQRAN